VPKTMRMPATDWQKITYGFLYASRDLGPHFLTAAEREEYGLRTEARLRTSRSPEGGTASEGGHDTKLTASASALGSICRSFYHKTYTVVKYIFKSRVGSVWGATG
jgi:hypothetical protein